MRASLSDLTRSDAVQAALDEYSRLGQKVFLAKYGFGKAREYVVLDPRSGLWADSKAIAAAAVGHQFPESGPLSAKVFSGGEATVAPRLQALGFRVERISEIAGHDWRPDEVALVVADYLTMLTCELTGQRYVKAAHRQQLLSLLPGRSAQAIEFKHANVSAVMLQLGFPYVQGYKPRANFQRSLVAEVARQVQGLQVLDEAALTAVQQPAVDSGISDFERVMVEGPVRALRVAEPERPYGERAALQRDYLERESQNRSLGDAGEAFALRFERWRLASAGLDRLAGQVEHVAKTQGDGLGYDIRSFELDGSERFIEVKTTRFGERTPFFVTANEAAFAREKVERFRLYRLYDFRASPRLFELVGPIERHCHLNASTFRASFS